MARLRLAAVLGALALVGLAGAAAAAPPKKAGATFRECPDCPEMVVIPAGSFLMGSPESEAGRDKDETQHKVTFAKPFAVAKNDITWDQWEECVRDAWCDGQGVEVALRHDEKGEEIRPFKDLGRGSHPFVGGSWYDAQNYVGWVNHKLGKRVYRLITESEWEYAARAGTATTFPWGDKASHDSANYGKDEGLGGAAEGRDVWVDETAPVGSFPANRFGLFDMPGNTYKWTADCYERDGAKMTTDGSAMTAGNCGVRVMRSTSYTSNPHTLRAANRVGMYPPSRRGRNYISIRMARSLD